MTTAPTPPVLSISRRTRSTPFTRRVTGQGVKGYTVYNRMLLPTVFDGFEADYHHLKAHVQVWDVACERQVEIRGRDARRLVQKLTPRNLEPMQDDQCYYVPVVDETGGMLNDPVAVKHDDDRWWISIADSDLLFWIKGLAVGWGLNVDVFEPDVSPLGVQGPRSDDLMARVFGESIRDLRFFRHAPFEFNGRAFTIARSGYSKQGGFEIYVDGSANGEPLWDALFDAGTDLNVRPGCPNLIERIEGGLLSYGNDMTMENNPYECGLGKFCTRMKHPPSEDDCIGAEALRQVTATGPARQIRGLRIDGGPIPPCQSLWPVHNATGASAGHVSSAAYSPDFKTNVAIAMVEKSDWGVGTQLTVSAPDGERSATVCKLPF